MSRLEWVEVVALLILGLANVTVEILGSGKAVVVALGAMFWGACAFWGHLNVPSYLRERGFSKPKGEGWPLFWGGSSVAALALVFGGILLGRVPVKSSFFWVVPLYLPWALVQQFFLCGVLLRVLRRALPPPVAVGLAALLFSLAHLPDVPLALFTFVAGGFWGWVFLRLESLYPIAGAHAVLGALVYYLILGQDVGQKLLQQVGLAP